MRQFSLFILLGMIGLVFSNCKRVNPDPRRLSWAADIFKVGTNSSPHLIDLNDDGILDVVIGTGKNEFNQSDTAILAINGNNGRPLWAHSGTDQVVGSAMFQDITGDDIPDVFIGGRNHQLYALNGKTGDQIWAYEIASDEYNTLGFARFNFYNPQFIPDQNGDKLQDLLVSNGGNVKAAMGTERDRYPGVLLILDSRTGSILAADTMPDGKETYMSPVVYDFDNDGKLSLLFGTGGETISGNFYKAELEDLVKEDLSKAQLLAEEEGHGYFAPPVLVDVTQDGIKDIVVNSHGGKMVALDGKTNAVIWQKKFPDAEASNTVAPGYFNEDDIPDFFSIYALGSWPNNSGTIQVAVNGQNGEVLSIDSIGAFGFFSPLTCDLNGDGFDEAIVSANEYANGKVRYSELESRLLVFDYQQDSIWNLVAPIRSKNQSSTPWIGDIDHNGKLDIVYCLLANTPRLYEFYGMQVRRTATNFDVPKQISWGAYMGNTYDGVFRNER